MTRPADQSVHVDLVGTGDDPVLLLPGGGVRDPIYLGDVSRWTSGRPVAVVHFRGTPATGGIPRPWWDQSGDLEALRRKLGLATADVLAHSSGTRVALAYAASGAPVRRLGLITPPATWLTGIEDNIQDLAGTRTDDPAVSAALAAQPMSLADETAFREHQCLTAPLGYARWTDEAKAHAASGTTDFGALQAFFGSHPPDSLLEGIRSLSAPIHIIGGGVDMLTGVAPVRALARQFSSATIEMIDDSGHYPWIDQPEHFYAAVARWIAAGE